MKAFNGLGPFVIVLRVRNLLGKAYDHSLICASIMHVPCIYEICMMMHAIYVYDMYIDG